MYGSPVLAASPCGDGSVLSPLSGKKWVSVKQCR